MRALEPALALLLLAVAPAAAQEASALAPETALRPSLRPPPEAPGRPLARAQEGEEAAPAAAEAPAAADEAAPEAATGAAEAPPAAGETAPLPGVSVTEPSPEAMADGPANPAVDPAFLAETPLPARAQLAAERPFYDAPSEQDIANTVATVTPVQRRQTFFAPTGPMAEAPALSPLPNLAAPSAPERAALDPGLRQALDPAPRREPAQTPVLESLAEIIAPGLEEAPFGPRGRPVPRVQPMATAPARPPTRPERALVAMPLPDPDMPAELPNGAAAPAMPELSPLAVAYAFRPPERPNGITQAALERQRLRERGAVCGNPDIQGERLGTVPGPGSCGVTDAVLIRSVGGIRLSYNATMDCETATALNAWVQRVAIPAFSGQGGGLAGLRIMGDYSCRGRNGDPNARLSEHAFGHAIDIGGVTLRDGTAISVLRDWGSSSWGGELRALHANACGIFGTVLGPTANAAHRDHFHFDTARYRSGSYCR
ncbi:extensin family protein [Pseudoroseicyclus sp. CXY001]|uniref:extensin family protein n=1 Tax=Pseudoroseicyclus sp. CXY001 TaxID=3242492 RepID=UPI003570B5CF